MVTTENELVRYVQKLRPVTRQYALGMVSYRAVEGLLLTLLLSAYFPTNYAQLEDTTQPEVTIHQGTLVGKTLTTRKGRSIYGFQGIPYGQPPIGNLRFANPLPADGWTGTLNATDDSIMCPQVSGTSVVGTEDCLYLNVYTPQLPQGTNSSLLPVMVYIHGGAFKMGSFTASSFGPGHLLDEDILFVIANYRLGPVGFLSTGDEVASGNWGLKDQVLVLKWVQDNIHYFGGNPDQVTLVGQGASGGAVHLLTLSNATVGLFHRYITQSGSALGSWANRPRAIYASRAFELGEFVGCHNTTSDALVSCLRTVDISSLIATQSQFIEWNNLPDFVWVPTDEPDVEGALLTEPPANLFAAGKIRDLPWICGIIRDDGGVLTGGLHRNEATLADFLENFDSLLPLMLSWTYKPESTQATLVKAAKEFYLNNDLTSNTSELPAKITTLVTDAHFYYPARHALQQHHALANNPQYFYTINYQASTSTSTIGIGHSSELSFFFPRQTAFIDRDFEVVEALVQLWASFITNGTPTATALNGAVWEPYSAADKYIRIGNESDPSLEVLDGFFVERMQFWTDVYATIAAEAAQSEDSGTVTSSPNLLFMLLVVVAAKLVQGSDILG